MDQNINVLVDMAKAGDDRAIGQIYEMFYARGINLAQYYVHNRSDAEDMYQDSFMKMIQHIDSFDSSRNFATWFNTIIANTCKNYLDRMRPDNFGDISTEDMDFVDSLANKDVSVMPEESFDMKEMTQIMDGIMGELPDAQRQALVLYYYNQMSIAEVAAVQQVPVDAVKSRLNYGRKKVAEGVSRYQKKSGTRLLAIVPALLMLYFRSGVVAKAATIADAGVNAVNAYNAVDTGLNIANNVYDAVDKGGNAKTVAKTAGKVIAGKAAKSIAIKATTGVIAATAIGGGVYVYETQKEPEEPVVTEVRANIKATDEAEFVWDGTVITGYTGTETDIVIPTSATKVAQNAFRGNTGIHSVDFSLSSVKDIDRMAFDGCIMLEEVILPGELETIGYQAFNNCSLISEMTIPSNVRKIGGDAFANCSSLTDLNIEATNIISCETDIFRGCALASVTFDENMTYIPDYLFYNAEFRPEIVLEIPRNVLSIGDKAFYSESSKSPAYIEFNGNKLTDIGYMSFYKCEIRELNLPDSLETIGYQAFGGCDKIKSVTIPSNVSKIGGSAFLDCKSLEEVVIESTNIRSCETDTFRNCALTSVTLNKDMTYIPDYLFYNAEFVGDVTIKIPKNVSSIGEKAFYSESAQSPTTFEFEGKKLEKIGYMAFYKCEMSEMTLPKTLDEVDYQAFGECNKLKKMTIMSDDVKFNNDAFYKCDNTIFAIVKNSNVEDYIVKAGFGDNITYIP